MASRQNHCPFIHIVPSPAFLGIALALAGCQLAFGDYKVGNGTGGSAGTAQSGGAKSSGGGTSLGGTSSRGGTSSSGGANSTGGSGLIACNGTPPYRCQNGVLQACTGGFWTTKQTCASPGLCQPATGVCDVCADGQLNCNGQVLGTCNTAHTAFAPTTTCVSPSYCDATISHCVVCDAGQQRCNGDYLDVCNAQRTAFNPQAVSCNGLGCQVVDGKADYCIVCFATDPPQCASNASGAFLRTCISGQWTAKSCTNGCSIGPPAACY